MAKKTYHLEYKYESHWIEYDRTQVESWRDTQFTRMIQEHPKAEHRISKK